MFTAAVVQLMAALALALRRVGERHTKVVWAFLLPALREKQLALRCLSVPMQELSFRF